MEQNEGIRNASIRLCYIVVILQQANSFSLLFTAVGTSRKPRSSLELTKEGDQLQLFSSATAKAKTLNLAWSVQALNRPR